jgi:hypothetical protein
MKLDVLVDTGKSLSTFLGAGPPLAAEAFRDVCTRLAMNHCKWDLQVADRSALCARWWQRVWHRLGVALGMKRSGPGQFGGMLQPPSGG